MQLVKLLSVLLGVLSLLSFAAALDCPATGLACYPGDCCAFFQQCSGSTWWPVQPTAPGTVCKAGGIVSVADCTTPCNAPASAQATQAPPTQATEKPIALPTLAPATAAPTQAPATAAPTVAPTTAPTKAPPTQATEKPIALPTLAPATAAPTQAPATAAPATAAPTQAPATAAPTQKATITPTSAPAATAAPGSCQLSDIFSQADFNSLFPHANGAYLAGLPNQHAIFNYTYLLQAAKSFPSFACTGSVTERNQELAAFLAHTSQETSGWWAGQPYNWGYYFSTEVGCTNEGCQQYCERYDQTYPCASGKGYYGRGPIQLSWNYNYGQVSQALYGNDALLRNPDMIFDEAGTAFATALWFWMTPQSPKPSCHAVMSNTWIPNQLDINAGRKPGFGMTTNIINGGLECGYTTPDKVWNRIGYYRTYASFLGVSAGSNLECNTMHSF